MKYIAASVLAVIAVLVIVFFARYTGYVPVGPEYISELESLTKPPTGPYELNESTGGGYIYTVLINTTQKNQRWKAYVGNITGKFVLQSDANFTIYDWVISDITTGEVYATRKSSSVNWTNINCTWVATGNTDPGNRSVEGYENIMMNHSSADDNITTTFSSRNHTEFFIGTLRIQENACYSLHTFVNNTPQTASFQEVILYEGDNISDAGGHLVYMAQMDDNTLGYDNRLYDFQLMLPEKGIPGFASSTAYYFYVDLG
ncbi:MAG: hypothetical protein ABIB71_07485 [Candidatus Woesearchaeota archaeon]